MAHHGIGNALGAPCTLCQLPRPIRLPRHRLEEVSAGEQLAGEAEISKQAPAAAAWHSLERGGLVEG